MGTMLIGIEKVSETETIARYKFNDDFANNVLKFTDGFGIIEINKLTGNCDIVKPMHGDYSGKSAFYAGRKLVSHWKNGEFPDKTCWAS